MFSSAIFMGAAGADLQKHFLAYMNNEQMCLDNAHLLKDIANVI